MPDLPEEAQPVFESPLGEPSTGSPASKVIPEEAIDALARTLYDYEDTDDDEITWEGYRPDAKDMLEQLVPILAAQVRRETAERIHDRLEAFAKDCYEQSVAAHTKGDHTTGTREGIRCVAFARASGVARQIGEADDPR